MGATLEQAGPRDGGDVPRTPFVVSREAPAAAVAEGAAPPRSPLSVGLPNGDPLVGNWSRVKHLLEGWGLPQNWGRVETREAAELAFGETEDCLEALSGCVAARIVGYLFLNIVERVIKERDPTSALLGGDGQ